MSRWTCHLALIAYLVGGWLLPALHHHQGGPRAATGLITAAPGHCHHGGHVHADPPARVAGQTHSACDRVGPTGEKPFPRGEAALVSVDASHGHGGHLCALCWARGWSVALKLLAAPQTIPAPARRGVTPRSARFAETGSYRAHPPRGPPAVA